MVLKEDCNKIIVYLLRFGFVQEVGLWTCYEKLLFQKQTNKTKAKYQEKGYNLFTLIVSISIWKIFDAIYAHIISWRGQAYGISAQVGDVSVKVVIIFLS